MSISVTILIAVTVGLFVVFFVWFVYGCYVAWESNFKHRSKRSTLGSPSHLRRPKLHEPAKLAERIQYVTRHESKKQILTDYVKHTEAAELLARPLRQRSAARSSLVHTEKELKRIDSRIESDCLDMDHIFLPFYDFLWGMLALAPNATLLQTAGVLWLIWRQSLQRMGLIRPKQHNPKETAANLVLESYRAMHYASQRVINGKREGVFIWRDFPVLDADGNMRVYSLFAVYIDLDERILNRATLDDREITAEEAIVVIFFSSISSDHVKIHALGNWACNVEQDGDQTLKRLSIVSICYNYFGFTAFKFIAAFWHRFLNFRWNPAELQKVFDHGIKQGIPAHAAIAELAPHSELVDFTNKLRTKFLNKFHSMRDTFPGVDGEAFFASTIVHSLDHQQAMWGIRDPLWIEFDGVRDEFKPMAQCCRFVRVGFVASLPLLTFKSRYSEVEHPFYQYVYRKACALNRALADEMDACIIR